MRRGPTELRVVWGRRAYGARGAAARASDCLGGATEGATEGAARRPQQSRMSHVRRREHAHFSCRPGGNVAEAMLVACAESGHTQAGPCERAMSMGAGGPAGCVRATAVGAECKAHTLILPRARGSTIRFSRSVVIL